MNQFSLPWPERALLDWLSREDSSAYGECHGKALDALVEKGLAQVENAAAGGFARVSLTAAGWAASKTEGRDL